MKPFIATIGFEIDYLGEVTKSGLMPETRHGLLCRYSGPIDADKLHLVTTR
jgi:hypothetical protein